MNLKVPELMQVPGSTNCQALCVQMILHYYHDMATMDEIMSGLEQYLIKHQGMHSEGPAIWLTERGYDVTYFAHDLEIIDHDIENLTEKDVAKLEHKLESLPKDTIEDRREKIRLAINLIKAGAKFSKRNPLTCTLG